MDTLRPITLPDALSEVRLGGGVWIDQCWLGRLVTLGLDVIPYLSDSWCMSELKCTSFLTDC